MSDPRRLIDEGADGFERGLLDAAARDVGSEAAFRRLAQGLGVVAVGTAAATAHAGAAGAGAAGAGKTAAAGASVALAKWVGIGILGGVVITGGAEVAKIALAPGTAAESHGGSAAGRAAPAVAAARPPARTGDAVAVTPPRVAADAPLAPRPEDPTLRRPAKAPAAEEVALAPPPAQPPSASEGATPASSGVAASSPSDQRVAEESLREEVRLIDGARAALRRRSASEALAALDRHSREFPRGVLNLEASVLRVEALLLSGDRDRAELLGRAIAAKQPNGPYAVRIRDLLGGSINP
jgi:hypothetical protein